MSLIKGISLKSRFALSISGVILITFIIVKTLLLVRLLDYSEVTNWFEYLSVIFLISPFITVVIDFLRLTKKEMLVRTGLELLINDSSLVSKANAQGKITYVNKKFIDVSGYSEKELIGQDHSVLNSGKHDKKFWINMYKTTAVDKKIWNEVVTNINKNGEEYVVNSWIMAHHDSKGKLKGYTSVRQDITEHVKAIEEIKKKDVYLEHAAKIIRHDMHSGINTYLPRGIKSLKRRLDDKKISELKLTSPLQLIEDGLSHAQKVYAGVYEFTNLVKQNSQMSKKECNVKEILEEYLRLTAYKQQVIIDDNLPNNLELNEPLFCTAIDNLIRNGLKYNDSKTKWVRLYLEELDSNEKYLCIEDNGRGMSQEEFEMLSKPYIRKEGQKESGTGLGLNICMEILREHGFTITSTKLDKGTKLKIKI